MRRKYVVEKRGREGAGDRHKEKGSAYTGGAPIEVLLFVLEAADEHTDAGNKKHASQQGSREGRNNLRR